ncbi:MAG: hypothetical protein KGO80_03290 [Bacteroidetes bacterium]|nr:hypothetical protein [Bacteroidota bacterium]
MFIEVGAGELIDKLTILEIKIEKINNPEKLKNIKIEIEALNPARQRLFEVYPSLDKLQNELKAINEALWIIEDDIRLCEKNKDFGNSFIELARSVYIQNDKRAEIKKKINTLCNAQIIEEKSYQNF